MAPCRPPDRLAHRHALEVIRETAGMSKPVGPYTPIFRAGEWLIVSGQVGILAGKLVSGGLDGELRQAVANLSGLLQA